MKKVLAAVVAAAMALSMSVSAFAAYGVGDLNKGSDLNTYFETTDPDNATYLKSLAPGKTLVSDLRRTDSADDTINATETAKFEYTVYMVGNPGFADDAHVWNFEETLSVKGPAEVVNSRIEKESFGSFELDAAAATNGWTESSIVAFDVTFELEANNEDATAYKGLVIKYGAKVADSTGLSRSGFKSGSAEDENYAAGYSNADEDALYDAVVAAFDDMVDYEEDSFEVALENNPVIPSSVIKFLQKNLDSNKSVVFVKSNDGDTVYFDSTTTLELDGKAIDEFSSTAHANIKVNSDGIDEISEILDEAGVDYKWFNYVVARDITGIHSLDSGYDDPYIYLVDAEGALTEIELISYDYGDVAFEGPMGKYIITEGAIPAELFVGEEEEPDEPIEDDDVIDEPIEDDDDLVDEDGNAVEENPGTGSSDAISVAVAMAVVSLAAAGVVASKKASK